APTGQPSTATGDWNIPKPWSPEASGGKLRPLNTTGRLTRATGQHHWSGAESTRILTAPTRIVMCWNRRQISPEETTPTPGWNWWTKTNFSLRRYSVPHFGLGPTLSAGCGI